MVDISTTIIGHSANCVAKRSPCGKVSIDLIKISGHLLVLTIKID